MDNNKIKNIKIFIEIIKTVFVKILHPNSITYCTFYKYTKKIPFLFIIIFFLTKVQAEISITPSRIIFDIQKKHELVFVTNSGKDSLVFSISFIEYNMTERGELKSIESSAADNGFSSNFLNIYPEKLIIPPGETKTIRLELNPTKQIDEKEYRSHLFLEADKKTSSISFKNSEGDKMNIGIIPLYNFSIPVIIRNTNKKSLCIITDVDLKKTKENKLTINFVINREGIISTFGDIIIKYINPDGNVLQITQLQGLAIYTNINKRLFTFSVVIPEDLNMSKGKFKIEYINVETEDLYALHELYL